MTLAPVSAGERARARRRWPAGAVLGALALAGATLIADALAGGGEPRHRAFGVALGVLVLAPAALVLALGARGARIVKVTAFALLPACALLLAAELLLRALDVEVFFEPDLLPDARLGHRFAPSHGGMDARGFRNAEALANAEVVCLGDSQMYGHGLLRSQSLPARIEAQSRRATYSMAVPAYGPVQYLAQIEDALALQPRVLILGLYLGNDVRDAWAFAGLPAARPLHAAGREYPPAETTRRNPPPPNLAMATFEAIRVRSRLVGWASYQIANRLKASQALADAYGQEPDAPRFAHGAVHTLLTPRYRLAALTQDDPYVREGLRLTKLCVEAIGKACAGRGVRGILLLLPTKESCYAELLARRGEDPGALLPVAAAEGRAVAELAAAAGAAGLTVLDARLPLVERLARDEPMWPHIADGHFSARGVSALAELVAAALR